MEAIQAFYEATNQLIELLQQDKLDRDVRIEKIQSLLRSTRRTFEVDSTTIFTTRKRAR